MEGNVIEGVIEGNSHAHADVEVVGRDGTEIRLDKRGRKIGKREKNHPIENAFKHGRYAKKVKLRCDLCVYGRSNRCEEFKTGQECVYTKSIEDMLAGVDVDSKVVLEGLKAVWLETYKNYCRSLDCANLEGGIPDKYTVREAELLTHISKLILDVTTERRGAIGIMTEDQRAVIQWMESQKVSKGE